MVLFHPFYSLARHWETRWRHWWPCFFSRFSFSRYTRYNWLYLALFLPGSMLFASCSFLSFTNNPVPTPTPKPTPTPATLQLAQVPWCGKPVMVFRNLAASGTPGVASGPATTLTGWTQVEPLLGFTVYLPTMLPNGSCLVSASGTVHDPILGGSFVIGYVLPDHSSLTLSQAPQRAQSATLQCNSTAIAVPKTVTPTPSATPQGTVQICSGAHGSTNIVFSASGNTDTLQQFFNALQPDVNWVPAS
jgi:hypothetical protein